MVHHMWGNVRTKVNVSALLNHAYFSMFKATKHRIHCRFKKEVTNCRVTADSSQCWTGLINVVDDRQNRRNSVHRLQLRSSVYRWNLAAVLIIFHDDTDLSYFS